MGKGNGHELVPSASAGKVDIDGITFRIRGLNNAEIVSILSNSPALERLLAGDAAGRGAMAMDAMRAVTPVITAGCDVGGDEKIAEALRLPAQYAWELAVEIIQRTFPSEDGPFGAVALLLRKMIENLKTIRAQAEVSIAESLTPLSATSSN